MSETLIRRSSLQAEVAQRLRTEIVEGQWRPGTRLQERLLCERYGISRSPLREAYQVLVAEGLIEVSPNKGAVVTAPTPSRIMQNFELLRALEILAVRLACEHADERALERISATEGQMRKAARAGDLQSFFRLNNEVHRQIVLASGNEPLADTHLIISRQIIRVQNLDGPIDHGTSEGIGQHDDILEALTSRDAGRAVSLFSAHLDTVEDNLKRRLQEFTPPA